jgi:hypothetical protein
MAVQVRGIRVGRPEGANPMIGLTVALQVSGKTGGEVNNFNVWVPFNDLFPEGISNPDWDEDEDPEGLGANLDPANLTPETIAEALEEDLGMYRDFWDLLRDAGVEATAQELWVTEVQY